MPTSAKTLPATEAIIRHNLRYESALKPAPNIFSSLCCSVYVITWRIIVSKPWLFNSSSSKSLSATLILLVPGFRRQVSYDLQGLRQKLQVGQVKSRLKARPNMMICDIHQSVGNLPSLTFGPPLFMNPGLLCQLAARFAIVSKTRLFVTPARYT